MCHSFTKKPKEMKRLKTLILTAAAGFAVISANANCVVSGTVSAPENPYFICDGNLGTLSLSITGTPDSVQWLRDGVEIPGETGNTITLNKWRFGEFSALLWCGGSSTPTSNFITVNQAVATNLSGTEELCFGNTISFSTPSISGASYEWFQGTLSSPVAGTSTSFSVTTPGNVFLRVTDNGCSKYAKIARVVDGGNCPVISITTPEDPYIICGRDNGILSITLPDGASYDSVQWFNDGVQVPGSGLSITLDKWSVGEYHAHVWFAGNFYNTGPIHVNVFHLSTVDQRICPNQRSHIKAPMWSTSATYEWILGKLIDPVVQSGTGVGTGALGGPDFYATPMGYTGNVWCKVTKNGCMKYAKIRILEDTSCAVAPRSLAKMDIESGVSAIYPNPSNGSFNLDLSGLTENEMVHLTITDMSGKVVYTQNSMATSSSEIIEIKAELATGFYAVKATQGGFNFVTRAIIK